MLSLEGRQDIIAWLDSSGIDQLVIISPHLDDAVLSLGGLIAAVPEITEVVTVHTEGAPDAAVDWSHAGGFADPIEEHAARRLEDQQAMGHLGCRFRHLGLRSGELNDTTARQQVRALWGIATRPSPSTLILLPAGAGGHQQLPPAKRLARRILRRPFGSMAHPEHESTRDHFWRALSANPARLGFYAEVPYVWNEAVPRLANRLSGLCSRPLDHVRIKPTLAAKLDAVKFYASQAELILGRKMSYRRRVLGGGEHLYLLPQREAAVD